MTFKGKVAIVTGSGQGIGRATAISLAKNGAKIVLVDKNESTIEAVANEIRELKADVLPLQTNVSKWEAVQSLAAKSAEHFGRIDLLVNNAGIDIIDPKGNRISALDIEEKDWDRVLNVNLKGQFFCSKAIIPYMIKQKYGRIVHVASTNGITGTFGTAPYCASKAGIMTLVKSLAHEFGPHNISVNCIAPGLTITPMHDHTPPEHFEQVGQMLPLRKVCQAEDIARAILFFLAEETMATGQTLVVDCGGTMH